VDEVASSRILMVCSLLMLKIGLLRRQGRWTVERLITAISVADKELAESLRGGLVAFEAADYWTALHVFVPQLERLVRGIAVEAGAAVHAFTDGDGLRWRSLEDLLDEASVRAVIGADMASELKAIYTSPFGPNLRNNLAHGALDLNPDRSGAALASLMALIAVSLLDAQARSQAFGSTAASPGSAAS
jgi:hypothetical protein